MIMSEPVGMGSGIIKNDFLVRFAVEHDPVALNMAIGESFIVAGKFMLAAAFGQRLTPNEKRHNIKDFVHVFMAFFHQFDVFFELIGKSKITQWLNAQIFPRFLKRTIPFCGQISVEDRIPFLYSGSDRCVKRRVFCAYRTFPVNSYVKSCFRFCNGHRRLLCFQYNCFHEENQDNKRNIT